MSIKRFQSLQSLVATRAVLVGVMLILLVSVEPAEAQVFSTPVNLSGNSSTSTTGQIGVDGQGNISVVWSDNAPGNFDLFFRRSADGVNFSAPLNLSSNTGNSFRPEMAIDSQGSLNVVWHDNSPGNFDVFFSRSTDGVNFSAPVNLSANSGDSLFPQIAVDGQGRVNVVWQDNTLGNAEIFFRQSADGVSFSAAVNVSANTGSSLFSKIAVDGEGNISLLWSDDTPGNSDIFFSSSVDGVNFSAPLNLSANSGSSFFETMVADDLGNVHVVWSDDTPGNFDIFYRRSSDGVTFSPRVNVSGNTGDSFAPRVGVDNQGTTSVVWHDSSPGNFDILYRHSADGMNFTALVNLSANTGDSVFPRMAVDGLGIVHVTWRDDTPGNVDILYRRSTPQGVNFSTPVNISANAGTSFAQRMALDGQGGVYAVWIDTTPGNSEIFFSRALNLSKAIQDLISAVVALNLKQGISNSLDAKLEAAVEVLDDLNENNNVAAINALQAFINSVEAQRGIHIPETDADALIAAAEAIIALLTGS